MFYTTLRRNHQPFISSTHIFDPLCVPDECRQTYTESISASYIPIKVKGLKYYLGVYSARWCLSEGEPGKYILIHQNCGLLQTQRQFVYLMFYCSWCLRLEGQRLGIRSLFHNPSSLLLQEHTPSFLSQYYSALPYFFSPCPALYPAVPYHTRSSL